jgi:hypothetical protein
MSPTGNTECWRRDRKHPGRSSRSWAHCLDTHYSFLGTEVRNAHVTLKLHHSTAEKMKTVTEWSSASHPNSTNWRVSFPLSCLHFKWAARWLVLTELLCCSCGGDGARACASTPHWATSPALKTLSIGNNYYIKITKTKCHNKSNQNTELGMRKTQTGTIKQLTQQAQLLHQWTILSL